MNLTAALGYLVSNPWSSSAGMLALAKYGSDVLGDIANGVPPATALAGHANTLLLAVVGLVAKDANVTGGGKKQ